MYSVVPFLFWARSADTSAYNVCVFHNGNGVVGNIQTSGSGTLRHQIIVLKENVTSISDGITRLKQLKPSRFNFIADALYYSRWFYCT